MGSPSPAFNASIASILFSPTLIDTFIPGYSLLADLLLRVGVDVSFYVSCFALGVAAWTAFHFVMIPTTRFLVGACSSSVVVEQYDPIFHHMLNWASSVKHLENARALRAESPGQYYDDFGDGDDEDSRHLRTLESLSEDTIFNFNNWAARAPPKFQPDSSTGFFFHGRHLFQLYRSRVHVSDNVPDIVLGKESLTITVLWLSSTPIKNLIEEAREFHLGSRTSTTTIRRPASKVQRERRHAWCTIAVRPSRPMATVVLDNEQKAAILQDMNDFLHPRRARWYSNRGIPYRRGYLFYGYVFSCARENPKELTKIQATWDR